MTKNLGKELQSARKGKHLSLNTVAEPSNISATYLQKLERGLVNSPSPRVLARLAIVLDTPYLHLMELAGYLDEEQLAEITLRTDKPKQHPLANQHLTPEEWKRVGTFIRDLISQRR